VPEVYLGGSSDAGLDVAAEHAEVYLTWGEPPAAVAEKLARVRERAAARGRTVRAGLRVHVITRDTPEQAWADADRLVAGLDPALVARRRAELGRIGSEGQRRMLALQGDDLVVAPNLWAGVGLVRGGAGTALVGSHEQVAQRVSEYRDVGIDELVLSGYPHLEEAWAVGEGLLPLLR
jgi:alkanesulfonate monooxygenase